jgi:hypothetical protein
VRRPAVRLRPAARTSSATSSSRSPSRSSACNDCSLMMRVVNVSLCVCVRGRGRGRVHMQWWDACVLLSGSRTSSLVCCATIPTSASLPRRFVYSAHCVIVRESFPCIFFAAIHLYLFNVFRRASSRISVSVRAVVGGAWGPAVTSRVVPSCADRPAPLGGSQHVIVDGPHQAPAAAVRGHAQRDRHDGIPQEAGSLVTSRAAPCRDRCLTPVPMHHRLRTVHRARSCPRGRSAGSCSRAATSRTSRTRRS